MPHASVSGHDLYCDRAGSGEPLLLVMGMSGTHRTWGEPFLDALRADFDVVVYDHRGIGLSSGAEPGYSIADLADDAAALLDAVGWDSAHVLGISMGGMVAQELALCHAPRVRTLALGCTYAGGEGSSLTSEAVFGRLGEAWSSGDRERALRDAAGLERPCHRRAMPAARLEILDGVGHLVFWERPEERARIVREHALGVRDRRGSGRG